VTVNINAARAKPAAVYKRLNRRELSRRSPVKCEGRAPVAVAAL